MNRQSCFPPIAVFLFWSSLAGCTVQLVAPYNSDLQQKASAMQAEVIAWDLKMRSGAGTISDDPRHPDVAATIDKWRGEAGAMLTLAASNDPGIANCSAVVQAIHGAIVSAVPDQLREATAEQSQGQNAGKSAKAGCETGLVDSMGTGIDDIQSALRFCKIPWIEDGYFSKLSGAGGPPPAPPSAPSIDDQSKLTSHCLFEFEPAPDHGRAVSALLTTLTAIVYVESQKKAAETAK